MFRLPSQQMIRTLIGPMFSRIAIVNRGEAARRLIHAARELSEERGVEMRVIALHTEAERQALFVREADEAVLIGRGGGGSPYLDHAELERALSESRADAAWVGWGFVAEDPAFADLCARIGVAFVGPPADVMHRLGDKVEAKRLAEEVGVPVAAWSGGAVDDLDAARTHAETIGYPLMIKASAGGGGRGIRVVEHDEELAEAYERARDEAQRSFGDSAVLMERLVGGARHVEVQIMADHHDNAWALGVRDCSIQRRNQKVIEESASPVLPPEAEQRLRQASVDLVRAAGYRNAGTVEFLYQPADGTLAFLEVNTRLQVEHPVTELTTGVDLVKLQLHVARGGTLEGDPPAEHGHAIEARLNAEDPERGFAPSPGTVDLLRMPIGPGVRIDTGIAEGDVIPPEYDSMIAKVIAWGRDRAEARARLRRALDETAVVVRGGTTNRAFLLDLLHRPEVISGSADTGWLDRLSAEGGHISSRHADVALLAAAVDAYDAAEALERERFYASARRGRPRAGAGIGRRIDLGHRGQAYRLETALVGPGHYRAEVDGEVVRVAVERLGTYDSRLTVGGRTHRVISSAHPPDHLVEVDGVAHRITGDEGGVVRAHAPSLVVAVGVEVGDTVAAGDPVAVLESMKMEMSVEAPFEGRVTEILVTSNVQVDAGAGLVRLEPEGDGEPVAAAPRVSFQRDGDEAEGDPRSRALALLTDLRSLITGFDVSPEHARELVGDFERARGELPPDDPELVRGELEILRAFADLWELFRDRPPVIDVEAEGEQVRSPREFFHAYLRSLDAEREGLPAAFSRRLERALAHYGVTDPARSDALAEAAYRIFLAQERAPAQLPAVDALLDRRARQPEALSGELNDELSDTLDLLIAATQLKQPSVAELARSVRFRCFDQPAIESTRGREYAGVRLNLDYIAAHPMAEDREQRMQAVVDSPQPLIRLLGERIAGGVAENEPILEVLTRRYYKIRELADLRALDADGRRFMAAEYERHGRAVRLLTTLADARDLPEAAATLAQLAAEPSDAPTLVADFYLSWPNAPDDPDAMAASLGAVLADAALPPQVRRVALAVAGRDAEDIHHFTFRRRDDDGLEEERVTRDLHPMIARRLGFGRLEDFDVTRLGSPEDTYLFHCVARENPKDERVVALAEVRTIQPKFAASGRLTALPEVERVLAACLDGIRGAQAGRSARQRLNGNHVFLSVSPPLALPTDEVLAVARTLAPMTAGLGLEEVAILVRLAGDDEERDAAVRISYQPGAGMTVRLTDPPAEPVAPLDAYAQKVLAARRRGTVFPYELVPLLAGPGGEFVEHDLDDDGGLVPVDRPRGANAAGIVAGVARTPTAKHPEGVTRVVLMGDPTRSLGSVAEPECARIIAGIDLAERMGVPVEWFALSSGAKISRDSGVENMDWVARALRRLITFTQDGGEVNVVVAGINVGAQPYWNAEATMLMHTKGILVMTPDSAMVLTGKQALDYSGGVSAEDNFGIGGFDRIMGPNGQAQYWAPDLVGACDVLMAHYEHTYVAPGERRPRDAETDDPPDRDVRDAPHMAPDSDFATVGEVFSGDTNPERKKAFDIRELMRGVVDQDHAVLERWAAMADADTAVVLDAHLGGHPVAVLGFESRPIARHRFLPADGPDQWTAGTLFPMSSKKAARAINAASGNRPLVVLANLSGFDGSPESLRKCQLEYGAEIGRAIVNFDGPILFCVISRYHGGAFVVFSNALNDRMRVIAVEGSYASVIGGAPAAAVVFAGDVNARTDEDPRVAELRQRVAEASGDERAVLQAELVEVRSAVRSETLGQVAAEFDGIHSVQRAQEVGSVHEIIPAARLRPHLIEALEQDLGD